MPNVAARFRTLLWQALAVCLLSAPALADPAADQFAVGAAHYKQRRWNLAAEEFVAYLDEFGNGPQAGDARFFLGESLVQLKDYAAAQAAFRELLAAAPEHPRAAAAEFRLGELSYFLGEMEAAEAALRAFATARPDDKLNAFVWPYLGDLALRRNDAEAARAAFAQGLEQFPQGRMQDDCRYGLARALEQLGEGEQAIALYSALASKRVSPLADDAQFRLAAALLAAQDYAGAQAAFTALPEDFPESSWRPQAALGCGQAAFGAGDFALAVAVLAPLADDPQCRVEADYWRGLAHEQLGQFDEAIAALQAAQAGAVDDTLGPELRFHLGAVLLRRERPADALVPWQELLERWPQHELADDALAQAVLACLRLRDGAGVDQRSARFAADYAASEHWPSVVRARAQSLLDRQEYAATLEWLAPRLSANDPQDLYLLALAQQGLGQADEALATLAQVRQADPQHAAALLLQANLKIRAGDPAAAVEPLSAYLAAADVAAHAPVRAELAACLLAAGDVPRAQAEWAAFLALAPAAELHAQALTRLAEAAYAHGQDEWARTLFGDLASLAADDPAAQAQALSGLAWLDYRSGDLPAAAEKLQRLLENYAAQAPASEAALLRGRILSEQGQAEAALAQYRRAVEQFPQSLQAPEALWQAARLERAAGNAVAAATDLQRVVQEWPDFAQSDAAWYDLAWARQEAGQSAESQAAFAQLVERFPDSDLWGDAVYRLAEAAFVTQDFAQATLRAQQLLAAQPASPLAAHAWYLLAQTAAAQQDWAAVAAPVEQVLATGNEALAPAARYLLAEACYQQQDLVAALSRFDELAQQMTGVESWHAQVALRRAQIRLQQEEWAAALQIAQSIAERWPEFPQLYEADYLQGRCLASEGRFDEARAAYRRVTRSPTGGKTETAAMAQWMIGESFFHQQEYAAAIREYLRVEILYAFPAWQAAALLQAGKCHEQLGEPRAAAEMYRRVLAEYADTPYAEGAGARLQAVEQAAAESPSEGGVEP